MVRSEEGPQGSEPLFTPEAGGRGHGRALGAPRAAGAVTERPCPHQAGPLVGAVMSSSLFSGSIPEPLNP